MTSGIDPAANGAAVVDAARRAGEGGAAMLFTPEMSNLIDLDRARAGLHVVAEGVDGVLAAARDAAQRFGIWIALGSIAVARGDGRLANRSIVIDAGGNIVARYDKIHMFDVDLATGESWRESNAYAPGEAWDGVTLRLPPEGARTVSSATVAWSVPGLRAELALEMLGSLPKTHRRVLQPFAPKVEELVRDLRPEGPTRVRG